MVKQEMKLKVKAVEGASVHYIGATNQGQVRFIGKSHNKEKSTPEKAVFDTLSDVVVLPYHAEYVNYLKNKSLLPADLATAIAAGVPFTEYKMENK